MTSGFRLRPATEADFGALLDLSILVMRDHLERVGRFDPARRRARMRAAFDGGGMQVVETDASLAGCIGIAADGDVVELHSLYLRPDTQGSGLGAALVAEIRAAHPASRFRVEVLKQSPARRFWERQGFTLVGEQPYDWVLESIGAPARLAG